MIKCNVTLCGTISRDASVRTGKDGKEFVSFPLQVSTPERTGMTGTWKSVSAKTEDRTPSMNTGYGSRAKVTGPFC